MSRKCMCKHSLSCTVCQAGGLGDTVQRAGSKTQSGAASYIGYHLFKICSFVAASPPSPPYTGTLYVQLVLDTPNGADRAFQPHLSLS